MLAIVDDGKYVGTYLCTVLHCIECFIHMSCTPHPPKPQLQWVLHIAGIGAHRPYLYFHSAAVARAACCATLSSSIHEAPRGVLCIRSSGEASSAIHEAPGGVLCIQSSGDRSIRGAHRAARQGVRQFIREMRHQGISANAISRDRTSDTAMMGLSFIEFGMHDCIYISNTFA